MSIRLALGLGGLFAGLVALDALLGAPVSLFLAREFVALIDWLAFWR